MPSLATQAQHIAQAYQPPAIGRPSDIGSESTVREFLEAVGNGNYIETSAKLAGLAKVTVYEWLKRGRDGEEPYKSFANAVEKAEARAEALLVQNVAKASEKEQFWAAGMTLLERRHPEKWGRRTDEQVAPRVVVQVGGQVTDVKILIAASPSPSVSEDLHRLSPSVNTVQRPINSHYVNQLTDRTPPTEVNAALPIVQVAAPGLARDAQGAASTTPQNFSPPKRHQRSTKVARRLQDGARKR